MIFANNVLAHVPDPNEIAAGIKRVLLKEGRAHVEVPYVGRMLELCAFDTIYHEHQCYFSVLALRNLFNRHGLRIVDIELVEIHGGSLHIVLAHEGEQTRCDTWCEREGEQGFLQGEIYRGFAERIESMRTEIHSLISRLKGHEGVRIVGGFGAAAKAVMFLNVMGIGCDQIPWVADVSLHKQGKFIPGTRQRIVHPSRLMEEQPEACVLFAWNLKDEIARRNAAYLSKGGRFVVAIPEVREITAELLTHAI